MFSDKFADIKLGLTSVRDILDNLKSGFGSESELTSLKQADIVKVSAVALVGAIPFEEVHPWSTEEIAEISNGKTKLDYFSLAISLPKHLLNLKMCKIIYNRFFSNYHVGIKFGGFEICAAQKPKRTFCRIGFGNDESCQA